MHFSLKVAVLTFLAQVALINATPIADGEGDVSDLVARGPVKLPTQHQCEAACTWSGFQGAAWQQCVRDCMASNYPSPPPSPPHHKGSPAPKAKKVKTKGPAKPKPKGKGKRGELAARAPKQRPTQEDCEAACILMGLQGAAFQQCVRDCIASNYPSPPPSPAQRKRPAPAKPKAKGPAKPKPKPKGYKGKLAARAPNQRPTQQECEVACTLAGLHGPAWQQCVRNCIASNYPSPPPSPPQQKKPAGKPVRGKPKKGVRALEDDEE